MDEQDKTVTETRKELPKQVKLTTPEALMLHNLVLQRQLKDMEMMGLIEKQKELETAIAARLEIQRADLRLYQFNFETGDGLLKVNNRSDPD